MAEPPPAGCGPSGKVTTMNARAIFVAATGLLIGVLSGSNAWAQTCATHAVVMEQLAQAYGESRQSIGMGSDNTVIEVYASLDTGTWTITVTFFVPVPSSA